MLLRDHPLASACVAGMSHSVLKTKKRHNRSMVREVILLRRHKTLCQDAGKFGASLRKPHLSNSSRAGISGASAGGISRLRSSRARIQRRA